MVEVFKYTERLVNMVRPRKLLFMAVGTSNLLDDVFLAHYVTRWSGSSCEDESAKISAFSLLPGGQREGRGEKRGCCSVGMCVCCPILLPLLTCSISYGQDCQ